MPIAPQSLYSQLWERGGKQMSLEFSLKCSQTLWRRGTLGRRSWKAESVVQPVPRSMMNAGVVDQEVQRQAVERLPGRPAPVHGHTGTPARRVCTLFAPAHEANADGKAAEWCGRVDWTRRRVKPLHYDLAGTDPCGTPYLISDVGDRSVMTLTYWKRSDRQVWAEPHPCQAVNIVTYL